MSSPRVIVVAISGPSSAGKTTLSAVLAESFASPAPIIHQDAYFRDKYHCPLASFVSTLAEEEFIQRSISDNIFLQYSIAEASDLGGGHEISGPDTDCDAAVNFREMYHALEQAKARAADLSSTIFDQPVLSAEDSLSIADNTTLIRRIKEKICSFKASFLAEDLIDFKLVIVDGFLLYTDPATQTPLVNHPESSEDHVEVQTEVDDLIARIALSALHVRATGGSIDEENEAKLAEYQESLWRLGQTFKYALESEYQVKLFLPTTSVIAKDRRFRRAVYQDAPTDEELSSDACSNDRFSIDDRQPGQMWKTEGYFDGVVWKNFEEKYCWLLKAWNEGRDWEDGVRIRPGDGHMDINGTADWAADTILAEWKVMIEQAQSQRLGPE